MIRHPITAAQLRRSINALKPNWFNDTQAIINNLPANPRSGDFPSKWTDIKQIYISLQGEKCIYCEMPIEGSISNDIEHFRPKTVIKKWSVPARLAHEGVVTTPLANERGGPGYHFLAYEPLNYAASCKFCNSVLKKNYFPISGPWKTDATTLAQTNEENAYLVYPIGAADLDPESIIHFHGAFPQAKGNPGTFFYQRALVTIELLALDDETRRKSLFASRARLLDHLFSKLRDRVDAASDTDRQDAIEPYLRSNDPYEETLYVKNTAGRCIVWWERNDEGGWGWTEGEGTLNALIGIREELMRGDYRALFLGWLADFHPDDWHDPRDKGVLVPPVPAGLDRLTPALQALIEQFPVDPDALAVAAGHSPDAMPERLPIAAVLDKLPVPEMKAMLERVAEGDGSRVMKEARRAVVSSGRRQRDGGFTRRGDAGFRALTGAFGPGRTISCTGFRANPLLTRIVE